jgi:hypothetical protein
LGKAERAAVTIVIMKPTANPTTISEEKDVESA